VCCMSTAGYDILTTTQKATTALVTVSCHRWRTYLRPDVKHPHLEPFTEWEAAVIVQAQREMGNNWLGEAMLNGIVHV